MNASSLYNVLYSILHGTTRYYYYFLPKTMCAPHKRPCRRKCLTRCTCVWRRQTSCTPSSSSSSRVRVLRKKKTLQRSTGKVAITLYNDLAIIITISMILWRPWKQVSSHTGRTQQLSWPRSRTVSNCFFFFNRFSSIRATIRYFTNKANSKRRVFRSGYRPRGFVSFRGLRRDRVSCEHVGITKNKKFYKTRRLAISNFRTDIKLTR